MLRCDGFERAAGVRATGVVARAGRLPVALPAARVAALGFLVLVGTLVAMLLCWKARERRTRSRAGLLRASERVVSPVIEDLDPPPGSSEGGDSSSLGRFGKGATGVARTAPGAAPRWPRRPDFRPWSSLDLPLDQ